MSPTVIVLLTIVLVFVFATAGFAVFGPSLEERRPLGVIGWLVRSLVGLAVVHTALGIYATAARMNDFGGSSPSERASVLADSLMSIIASGGILLALAGLLHLLDGRRPAAR